MGVPIAGPPRTPRPAPPETADSPRIVALAASVAGGRAAAVREFWDEVEAQGAPLVEPLPWDPEHRAVTFLWRGTPATRRVLVLVNRLMDRGHLARSLMRRLPGTDVWHLTYRLPSDHRGTYTIAPDTDSTGGLEVVPEPGDLQRSLLALVDEAVPDPFNTRTIPSRWRAERSSVFELPDAPPQPWRPWVHSRTGGAHGRVERHRISSAALAAERAVWTYTPPGRLPDEGADMLVLLDGDMWFGGLGAEELLDRLIAERAIPPLVVLAPDAVDSATRAREFGGRQAYTNFLAAELLPWAAGRMPVTYDPTRTVVAGESLGALTALYAGLAAPGHFGKVLAQSPSLWWRPEGPEEPGAPEAFSEAVAGPGERLPWLTRRFAQSPPRDLRLHLRVGRHEGGTLERTRELYGTLRAAGAFVTCQEFSGGHDYACWSGGLAEGLVRLLGPGER